MLSNCSAREDLRVPCTAKRSESILKEINPEYSLEGLKLKLKLQNSGHLMPKGQLIGKNSDAGKDWRQEDKEWQRITDSMNMTLSKLREMVKDMKKPDMLQSTGSQRVGHNLATEQQHSTQYSLPPKKPQNNTIKKWAHVHLWLIHVDVWQKPSQYFKVISFQLN